MFMSAQEVAAILKKNGFNVINVEEGDDVEDGMLEVTDTVHVTAPTFGGGPCVVRELPDGCFEVNPQRKDFAILFTDLRTTLAAA